MNKKALGLAGLGAVALVGGTLAYFTAESRLENPFTTGDYNTELHEEYTPPTEDLEPGAKWEKKVGATNTGDYPVLVRIKMDEKWVRKGEKDAYKILSSTAENNKGLFLSSFNMYDEETGKFTADQEDVDLKDDLAGETDGLVGKENKDEEGNAGDGTTVYKDVKVIEDAAEKGWYYNPDDGYFYWTRVLEANNKEGTNEGSKTTNLMENLVLASNIDMGVYNTTEYIKLTDKDVTDPDGDTNEWTVVTKNEDGHYIDIFGKGVVDDKNEDGQVDMIDLSIALNPDGDKKIFWKSESALDPEKPGYANSNYTLGITAQFVQATSDAVTEAWGEEALAALTGIEKKDGDTTLVNVKDTTTDTPDPTEPTDPIQ